MPAVPVVLPIVAILSGWWVFVALPLCAVMLVKMFKFIKEDADRYDILQVFLCGFLVCVFIIQDYMWIWSVLGFATLLYCHKPIRHRIHGHKVEYAPENEPWLDRFLQLDATQEVEIAPMRFPNLETLLEQDDWQQKASAWMIDRKVFRYVRQDEELMEVHHQDGAYGLSGYSGTVGYMLELLEEVASDPEPTTHHGDTVRVIEN